MLRRPIVRDSRSSSSGLWDEQAADYWKKMDQEKNKNSSSNARKIAFVACLVVFLPSIWYFFLFRQSPVVEQQQKQIQGPSDEVRKVCRETAVTSAWHQNSCENICSPNMHMLPKPIVHTSCMNGCSYGTISITKKVCAEGNGTANDEKCPVTIDCDSACLPYDQQLPRPTLRRMCEDNCRAVSAAACQRAVTILQNLYKQSKQNKQQE